MYHQVLCGALLALASAAGAADLPAPVRDAAPPLERVGRGEASWFGFRLYEASLWSESGRFQRLPSEQALLLRIDYHRRFETGELVEATREEWRRLALVKPAKRRAWAERLRAIWPDVGPGDSILTLVRPRGETVFYDRGRRLGRIADPAFGPALLAIWLDPRTRLPELRAALLSTPAAEARRRHRAAPR